MNFFPIRGARLEWLSYTQWAAMGIAKTVIVNNINKKRPRGQPKQWRLNVVKKDVMDLRPKWNGDLNNARNREEWKQLVKACKSKK